MADEPTVKRVAYSPGEFAELFGKSQTWGYRQIYSGKVNAITEHGRILIPAKEVEHVLQSAGIYNGKEKPKQSKARIEKLTPEQRTIWQKFVQLRREAPVKGTKADKEKGAESHPAPKWQTNSRKSVLGRIAQSWGDKSAGS